MALRLVLLDKQQKHYVFSRFVNTILQTVNGSDVSYIPKSISLSILLRSTDNLN